MAVGALGDRINDMLDNHADAIALKHDDERPLSLVVATSLGKAMKTFQAIERLCVLGFGEDALIALRSNVNLLINTAYILAAPNPNDRVIDFLAYSALKRAQFLRIAFNEELPWNLRMPREEAIVRAKRWDHVGIADRARVLPAFHYDHGYRFYSSFEHSEAMALGGYIEDWNEVGPRIQSGPSDTYVGIALVHSYGVMADFLSLILRFFGIDRPDIEKDIRDTWATLNPEPRAQ